jgi:hypothetical protein
MAVGSRRTIITTADGGITWKPARIPYWAAHPAPSFTSVRCPVSGVCSVLAPPNVIFRTTDGGQTWTFSYITLPPQLSELGRLACPTRPVCYVTASPAGTTFTWFTHSAAIFKTANGGESWNKQSIPSRVHCPGDCGNPLVGYDLQWISCQSAQSCRAGGDTFIGSHEGYASGTIRTGNGGAMWSLANNNVAPNIGTCPTTSICVGIYYEPTTPTYGPDLYRSENAGSTWSVETMPVVLTAIACSGPSFCALAGPHGKLAVLTGSRITSQPSPTTRDLSSIACPRTNACYAVGSGGVIVARKG